MNQKLLSIIIIILLLVFGIGYSIGSYSNDGIIPSVEIMCNHRFGKAPLNVSFSSSINDFQDEIESYNWNFNDGTTSKNTTTNHTFFRDGIFNVSLRVNDVNGHSATDYVEIIVIEYNKPIVLIRSDKTYGKAPLKIEFNAICYDIDGDKFTYEWDFDDDKTSNLKNPIHTFTEKGNYKVHLTIYDDDGQEDTDSIEITAIDNNPPIAYASADKYDGKAPLTVQFMGDYSDIDGEQVTYSWYFEDLIISQNSASSKQNPTHTFYSPGTYLVRLTVEDEDGAKDTDIVRIFVKDSIFSNIVDHTLNVLKNKFINGAKSELLGNILGNFLSNFLAKIFGNILARIIENNQ